MDKGFRLHDTMIYEKTGTAFASGPKSVRYTQIFEYCFILSKGKPKTINLIQDKKNKLIMEQHDLSMIRLQNQELRRRIQQLQDDNKEIDKRRIKAGKELDKAYQDLFTTNESLKLFNKTLLQMNKAETAERACIVTLQGQIKQLKDLLYEEKTQREQYKSLQSLQGKQIATLS